MRTLLLNLLFFLITFLGFSQDRILYPAVGFEHPLHLDVYVSVVECNGSSTVLITTFNESPSGDDIRTNFKIIIEDSNGQSETFYFPTRTYEFGKMEIGSCENAISNDNSSYLNWNRENSTKEITLIFDYED